MTHRYDERNPSDALYVAARNYPGGIEALAARMGMSSKVLYKKLGPRVDSHHVTYDEVQLILDYMKDAGMNEQVDSVINAFAWKHDRVVVKLPEVDVSEEKLFTQMLEIMSNHGVLADAVRDALSDGVITRSEMDRFEKDYSTCMLGLIRLRKSVKAKYDEGK